MICPACRDPHVAADCEVSTCPCQHRRRKPQKVDDARKKHRAGRAGSDGSRP